MPEFNRDQEDALVRAFVTPSKRARYSGFLSSRRRRVKFIRELAHFRHFDPRCIRRIPVGDQDAPAIVGLLEGLGAGARCYAVSVDSHLDGRWLALEEAVATVVGHVSGALISCIAGELAFFEGEAVHDRHLLVRRP